MLRYQVGVRNQTYSAILLRLRVVFEDSDLVAREPVEGVEGDHSTGGEVELPFELLYDERF